MDGVARGLAGLGGDVADVDLDGGGGAHRLDHPVHQQIGQKAGVKTARSDHHHFRVHDRQLCLGVEARVLWDQEHPLDRLLAGGNLRLAHQDLLPGNRAEGDRLQGGGDDLAPDRQHPAGLPKGMLEVTGDVAHGHDEEIAEGVAAQ